jgi:transketolase
MRNAFAAEITIMAAEDERIVLLSGDIGNRLFDGYKERISERFLNCGVAEANMMGLAAGMALCGLRPVVYTITPFATVRCLEQIRIDVCYQNVPVVIVGTGAGLSYASLNATHHSCEEVAFLRMLPNMTVICPGDPVEVRLALRAALKQSGPAYIRLGKKGEPIVHQRPPEFIIGKGIVVLTGNDLCLLSTGNMLPTAVQVADELNHKGLSTQVVSLHTVKPLDEQLLVEAFSKFMVVATLEEHSVLGGLGGSVAEWLANQPPQKARLLRIGTADEFLYRAGDQTDARDYFGLVPENIVGRVLQAYLESKSKQMVEGDACRS